MKTFPHQTQELLDTAADSILNIENERFMLGGRMHLPVDMKVDDSDNKRTITFTAERVKPNYSAVSYKAAEQHRDCNLGPVRRFRATIEVEELESVVINSERFRLERDDANPTAKITFHSVYIVNKRKIADYIFREYEAARRNMPELPLLFRIDEELMELQFDHILGYRGSLLLQNVLEDDEFNSILNLEGWAGTHDD